MIEFRWLVWNEEVSLPFDFARDPIGGPARRSVVEKRKLQYRKQIQVTDYQADLHPLVTKWTDWLDVPEVML